MDEKCNVQCPERKIHKRIYKNVTFLMIPQPPGYPSMHCEIVFSIICYWYHAKFLTDRQITICTLRQIGRKVWPKEQHLVMILTRLWHHVLWKLKTSPSSPFTNRIVPLSQKSWTRTQSEVTLPLYQEACGKKVGVSNYEAYNSGNLPHIPELTASSHVHLLVLRILKTTVLSMLFCIIFIVFLETLTKTCIWIIVSKVKFQNAYSIQHIKHLVHKKWKH